MKTKILIVGPGTPPPASEILYAQQRRYGKSMRCNPDIKKKIVIVGPDAQAFIDTCKNDYPNAEFVAAEKPPEDDTPYVFTDPELQRAKPFIESTRALKDDSPDPVSADNEPRNRRERRALAAINKRRR